jgi:hypothetical protein
MQLDPNSPAYIEGAVDLPVDTKAFEEFSKRWLDFLADWFMIGPRNITWYFIVPSDTL